MKNYNIITVGETDSRIKATRIRAVILIAFIIFILTSLWVQIVPVENGYMPGSTNQNYQTKPITIVTGASRNHFCALKAFIYTMKNILRGLDINIVVYDLGLSPPQSEEIKKLRDDGYFYEYRTFNFSEYPSFWDIKVARGQYAWKPGMVKEISKDYPGIIIWLDSGTLPESQFFESIPFLLEENNGFISPRSGGDMKTWTHPGVYKFYNDYGFIYEDLANCNGASMVFDTSKTQNIIDDWYSCALIEDCIAPEGSSRENHRQDQAIVSYLAAREGRYCNILPEEMWIHTHQDVYCKKIVAFYEKLYQIN